MMLVLSFLLGKVVAILQPLLLFTGEGIGITVIDLFTIKPVDRDTVLRCASATGGKLITVEDHYPEGGIGSAVSEAISDVTGISTLYP